MPKVQCGKCVYWLDSGQLRLKRGALTSSFHNYEHVGVCINDKCAENTSGYTGMGSGHKMSRREKVWRYCKFFERKSVNSVRELGDKEDG